MCGVGSGSDRVRLVDLGEFGTESIDARLETFLQSGENSILQRFGGGSLARFAIIVGDAHAVRVVYDNSDDVLLGG